MEFSSFPFFRFPDCQISRFEPRPLELLTCYARWKVFYRVNSGRLFFSRRKTALSMPVGGSRLWKIRGSFSRERKPWACLLDVQGFQKSRAYFSLEKHTSVEHARVQGFRKSRAVFSGTKTQPWARPSDIQGFQKIQLCKGYIYIIAKQIQPFSLSSCAAQLR